MPLSLLTLLKLSVLTRKGGALLFDDDELDMAEEAQKRMEVHEGDASRTQRTASAHGPHAASSSRTAPPPPATHR